MLVGMNYLPNQFSRAIESYGAECVHISGDPGGFLPTKDIDACIIAKVHCSHEKMWAAKDHCKLYNIPWFMIETGFSAIKERFETEMQTRGYTITRKGAAGLGAPATTVMADALAKAKIEPIKLPVQTKIEPTKEEAKPPLPVVKKEKVAMQATGDWTKDKDHVRNMIIEAANAGYTAQETLDLLIASGYKHNHLGNPWSIQQIYTRRYTYKTEGFISDQPKSNVADKPKPVKVAEEKPAPVVEKVVEKSKPKPVSIGAETQMELIGKVMNAKLPVERKLELVEEIHAGLMTTENAVMTVRAEGKIQIIMRNIFAAEDTPLVILDKLTAIAVLQSMTDIQSFVDND